jgi:hypothetical protein
VSSNIWPEGNIKQIRSKVNLLPRYKELNLELFTEDAVKLLIDSEIMRQKSELEETIEYSNAYLELANIAFQHDQQDYFKQCLKKTWDFVLGYGHHKDPTIFDVLNPS